MIIDGLWGDLKLIGLAVGVTLLIVGLAAGAALQGKKEAYALYPILFGLSLIGAVAGIAGGTSRVGVVGDVVPAALALIGTVSIYVFGAQKASDREPVVAFGAAAFALSLGLGYAVGAANRGQADAFLRSLTHCGAVFSNEDVLKDSDAFWRAATVWGDMCMEVWGTEHARTADTRGTADWERTRLAVIQRMKYDLSLARSKAETSPAAKSGD